MNWHPVHRMGANQLALLYWSVDEFFEASGILVKFALNITKRSKPMSPRNPSHIYAREITISNIYDVDGPNNSFYWVDMTDKDNWWISQTDLQKIQKYGWTITIIDP